MVCNVITADKASRLYWLGRYAERVYITLHLLRRYYDRAIDGDTTSLDEYYKAFNIDCSGHTSGCQKLQLSQLYDRDNSCSVFSSLALTKENAITMRRDISSESLSYIQMSHAIFEECAAREEINITPLQSVTDYMLAFFGSIDERVFDKRLRRFIKIGKFIENIDLHIRFSYPYFRIEEAYASLRELLEAESTVVNHDALEMVDSMIDEGKYNPADEEYKMLLLAYLNRLISI